MIKTEYTNRQEASYTEMHLQINAFKLQLEKLAKKHEADSAELKRLKADIKALQFRLQEQVINLQQVHDSLIRTEVRHKNMRVEFDLHLEGYDMAPLDNPRAMVRLDKNSAASASFSQVVIRMITQSATSLHGHICDTLLSAHTYIRMESKVRSILEYNIPSR